MHYVGILWGAANSHLEVTIIIIGVAFELSASVRSCMVKQTANFSNSYHYRIPQCFKRNNLNFDWMSFTMNENTVLNICDKNWTLTARASYRILSSEQIQLSNMLQVTVSWMTPARFLGVIEDVSRSRPRPKNGDLVDGEIVSISYKSGLYKIFVNTLVFNFNILIP